MCTNNFEPISVYFVLKLNYPIFHPILIKLFFIFTTSATLRKRTAIKAVIFQLINEKMILIHYIERSIDGQIIVRNGIKSFICVI